MKIARGIKALLKCLLFFSFATTSMIAQEARQANSFQAGLAALQETRYADALEKLTEAERETPDDPRVHNFRGIALSRLGQNDSALAEYREAIRLNPSMEDAYRNVGFLEWTEHQLQPAREALEKAVQQAPNDSFAHYYLGRVQLEAQQYATAIQELEKSRMTLPTDVDFMIQLATAYSDIGRTDDARKLLASLNTVPLDDAQSIRAASVMLMVHDNDAAIRLIEKLKNRHPASRATWAEFDLALAYLLVGKYEEAAAQAHVAADAKNVEKGGPQTWSLMGIVYAHLNQTERSLNAFRQATRLAPTEEEHWLNLTRELMELNRFSEAIAVTQQGLVANPKSYALHLRLGAAELSAGRYAEAESIFRELVTAGDPLPTSSIGLAQVLLRTDRAQEAASELDETNLRLGPNFLLSYFRGLALDRAGKPQEAKIAFQEAVRLNPANDEAHLNLGKTELALGQFNDAILELTTALRLNQGSVRAKRLLGQAYRRIGDPENAAKFAAASADVTSQPEAGLVGDFFVPHWRFPSATSERATSH